MPPEQLVPFVRTALTEGRSREDIYRDLLAQSHGLADIQAAVAAVDGESHKEDTQKRVVRIILVVGAMLVAAGVFSFIASNWQGMPREARVTVIVGFMLIMNVAGWFLREQYGYEKTGEAFLLLGSLIYGGGIFLVGQMYNIRTNWPDGFILWMLGVIPMALAVNSRYLLALGLPIAAFAMVGHPIGLYGGTAGYSGYLFTSTLLLAAATLSALAAGYVIRRKVIAENPGTLS